MASHYKIRAQKTGHYFMHGHFVESTKYVWICLHGYGQLAKHFIKRFEFLDPNLHVVIAPEGLNRFYYEGVNDRPVATWMTREDRLDEIADFIGFLEALRKKIGWDKNQNIKVIYFGFSQGATTLFRWLLDATPRADYMLLWAGGLPDDLLFTHRMNYLSLIQTHYFLGESDQYIGIDEVEKENIALAEEGLHFKLHYFPGTHMVQESILKDWMASYL
jgi:predicted esterase